MPIPADSGPPRGIRKDCHVPGRTRVYRSVRGVTEADQGGRKAIGAEAEASRTGKAPACADPPVDPAGTCHVRVTLRSLCIRGPKITQSAPGKCSARGNLVASSLVKPVMTLMKPLLSVCAFCDDVRDPLGRWTYVNRRVLEWLDYRLRHGICRECVQRHIPEFS